MQIVSLLFALAGATLAPAAASPASSASLVGTWRLIAYEEWLPNGSVERPFGDTPSGSLVYDDTGHMHLQVMRTPPMVDFPGAGDGTGDPLLIQAAYQGYVAYYGTYTVDWSHQVVTHHVEGSLQPDYTATDQPRSFQLASDHFIIQEHDPLTGACELREWVRVRSPK
jgi:Lipocalin-like domain